MKIPQKYFRTVLLLAVMLPVTGCIAVKVVDTVAFTAIGVTKVAVKGTVAAAKAVIPGDSDDKKKKKK